MKKEAVVSMVTVINVGKVLGVNLTLRLQARALFKLVKGREVVFDFKNVEFITRSFASEYLILKKKLNLVSEVNVSKDLQAMLLIANTVKRKSFLNFEKIKPVTLAIPN